MPAPANFPFASIDQFRLAQSPLDVPAMRRGWLRHPRRLAVGHSYSPDQFESRPETLRDDVAHDIRDIIIAASVNMHPRMILPPIILGQRERREEEEQASETFHVSQGH